MGYGPIRETASGLELLCGHSSLEERREALLGTRLRSELSCLDVSLSCFSAHGSWEGSMKPRMMLCSWVLLALSPLAADDFSDDFNRDDGVPDGWVIYSETVRIVDEELLLESGGGREVWAWVDVDEPFSATDDMELTIEFDILFDPSDSNPTVGRHGGIMFLGSRKTYRYDGMDGYVIDWIDRGSDHGYRFHNWTNGRERAMFPDASFQDHPDPAETWKITVCGPNISFEVDGEFLVEFEDANYREGSIGFWGWSNGQHIRIDNLVITEGTPEEPAPHVLPGDINGDGARNISDPVALLGFLFGGSDALPACFKVPDPQRVEFSEMGNVIADFNDDGSVNLTDAVADLNNQFGGAQFPPHVLGSECIPMPGPCPDLCTP